MYNDNLIFIQKICVMRMNFVIIEETKKFMCNIYRFELELNSTHDIIVFIKSISKYLVGDLIVK